MKKDNNNKKPLIYYYIVSLIVIMIVNGLYSAALSSKMVKINYNEFVENVNSGHVEKVDIIGEQILFSKKESENSKDVIYITEKIEDPNFLNRLLENNVPVEKISPREDGPFVRFLKTFIIPIFFMVLLGQIIGMFLSKRMGKNNAMTFGKSNAKVYVPAESGKTFKDVAGQDEAKEALSEIVDFLHNPEKYSSIGAVMPKGALLVGPPGTGKTLLAQAVAGEANVPFFSISGSEFVEMFVGMGAARVRDLFKQAHEKAPCIVFIDEIDTIGKKRDNGPVGGNDEREQTLNQLLTEMDGFDGSKGVVILAATNRPDSLDKALLRPGRFDRRIPAELPDLPGREAILKVHSEKIKTEPDVDYNTIARATAGASGAELANIINEGALRAIRMGRNLVAQSDLEEAVEVVIAGYQRKNAVISDNDKKIIAYHEVGHALVAALQKDSAPVHKITIIPRTSGALGYTMQIAEEEEILMSKEEALNKIATYTGGRAAEELIFNSITSGASNDIEQATKLAKAMVTRLGMSDKFGMVALETVSNQYLGGDSSLACSPETASEIDREVQEIIGRSYDKAKTILNENIDKLHEISEYLLDKETITGEEFMEILHK